VSAGARKMSLAQATMLVAGNMIGTGIFLLPVNLAHVGSISVYGWLIATAGAAALGLVFARLGQVNPQQGGPYAYARDFLGPFAGFQTNYIYWFGNWVGNIAIAVAAVGYLAELVPNIDAPPASTVVTALVIWVLTFANILGPRVVGALEAWTMALALIPIVAVALLGWWWFDPAVFKSSWNVSGDSDWSAISRAASMVLWAYMGIESAAVSAGVIENPSRNIPLATMMGLVLAAVVYMLSSTVIMGIIPAAQLQTRTRLSPKWRALPSARPPPSSSASARCSSPWARWVAGCCWSGNPRRRPPTTACSPRSSASSTNTACRSRA
jgi:arginine:agmatine antiporter